MSDLLGASFLEGPMTISFGNRISTGLGLLLIPAISGCLPVIAHGPRVEPGGNVSLVTAAEMRRDGTGGGNPTALFPNVGLSLSHGWRSSNPEGGAMHLGVYVPGPVVIAVITSVEAAALIQGDVYYQVPQVATPSIDAGIGLHGSYGLLMPYVQVGSIGEDGSGWYTTQGLAIARGASGYDGERMYSFGWMPSLAYQSRQGRSTMHFFASAFFVTTTGGPYNSFPQNGLALTAGLIAMLHGRQDKR